MSHQLILKNRFKYPNNLRAPSEIYRAPPKLQRIISFGVNSPAILQCMIEQIDVQP